MSYRNGLTVTGHLLLHPAYNPSASHPLSTSPYTGEARGGGRKLAFPSPVQKEEGLREEHGSARQIARGPRCGAARRFRRNARDRKGELANPKGLTEGLWAACRNGLPITGHLLLYPPDNPSGSHSFATSPFDRGRFCGNAGRHRKAGRARSHGRNHVPPVNPLLFGRGTKGQAPAFRPPWGRQGVVGACRSAPLCREARGERALRGTARRFRRNARDQEGRRGVGVGPLQSSSMAVFWGGSTWPTMALQGAKGRSSAKSRSA